MTEEEREALESVLRDYESTHSGEAAYLNVRSVRALIDRLTAPPSASSRETAERIVKEYQPRAMDVEPSKRLIDAITSALDALAAEKDAEIERLKSLQKGEAEIVSASLDKAEQMYARAEAAEAELVEKNEEVERLRKSRRPFSDAMAERVIDAQVAEINRLQSIIRGGPGESRNDDDWTSKHRSMLQDEGRRRIEAEAKLAEKDAEIERLSALATENDFDSEGMLNRAEVAEAQRDKAIEALKQARDLVQSDHDSLVESYTILAANDPDVGQLSAEGREQVKPYQEVLSSIDAALSEITQAAE